jgi:ABC-type sugar transport system permease subunit/ABC-type glycerol-3-phosphate transport system substrate-binding protein
MGRPSSLTMFLLLALLASGLRGGGVIEYQMQPASYGTRFFQDTADRWARNSGWSVRVQGDPRVHDKVRVRVMAGEAPDATDATLDYEALIAAGRLVDLTPWLDGPNWEGTGQWRDDFVPGILERWTRGGRVYGLPYAYAQWVLFFNEGLLEREDLTAPATWDEFLAVAGKLRARGIAPLAFPGVYPRYGDAVLRAGLFRLGGRTAYEAFRAVDPAVMTTPALVRPAAVLQRLAGEAFMPGWEGMTHTAAQQAFFEGRAAMVISASWMLPEMRGKIPEGFQMGVANLPQFQDGTGPAGAVQAQAAYSFVFRSGDAARERATVDFFRYLCSAERARAFAREIGGQVALRSVGPEEYTDPGLRALAELMAAAPEVYDAAPPLTPEFQSFQTQGLSDARLALLTGKLTPEAFGERLAKSAQAEHERIRNPDTITVRHGTAAMLLLAVVGGLLVWLVARREPVAGGALPRSLRLSKGVAGLFLGLPLTCFAAFILLPGLAALAGAFVRWNGVGSPQWAGLTNFRFLLLESDVFWSALRNNLFLMIVPTLVVVPVALFFAALLHRGVAGAGVFRAVFLFPNLLGGTAAALLWLSAYDPHSGLVNAALTHLGDWLGSDWLRSFAGYAWLSPARLYWALVPIYLWMACGFNLVLYLAAMQRIEPELYEAAEIDGASSIRQFFLITLPLIWDIVAVSAVFVVIAGLNTFEMVWLLTAQEPAGGSHVLSTLMVSTLFREYQVGRATALAVVLTVLVLVVSLALRRVLLGRGGEETGS